jgi:hypothetical protein
MHMTVTMKRKMIITPCQFRVVRRTIVRPGQCRVVLGDGLSRFLRLRALHGLKGQFVAIHHVAVAPPLATGPVRRARHGPQGRARRYPHQ